MKTQPTTTQRKSFRFRFFFLLILATFSPPSLVCAQTATSTQRAKNHVSVGAEVVPRLDPGNLDVGGISVDGGDDEGIWMAHGYVDISGNYQIAVGKILGKRN